MAVSLRIGKRRLWGEHEKRCTSPDVCTEVGGVFWQPAWKRHQSCHHEVRSIRLYRSQECSLPNHCQVSEARKSYLMIGWRCPCTIFRLLQQFSCLLLYSSVIRTFVVHIHPIILIWVAPVPSRSSLPLGLPQPDRPDWNKFRTRLN